jgi:mRNA-degrading endonuclease RelE of RelBE toxin-antitoxin system
LPGTEAGKSVWDVRLSAHAARDLERLQPHDSALHEQLIAALRHLKTEPFPAPPKGKKLRGLNGMFWRLRVGAYRILYRPIEPQTLFILRVIPRRELERALRTL